jgi:hypothetical protein
MTPPTSIREGRCRVSSAATGDTHPWALRASQQPPILRKLLAGAEPVCVECRQAIPDGAPKVTVPNRYNPQAPWWRCSDCEYRITHG